MAQDAEPRCHKEGFSVSLDTVEPVLRCFQWVFLPQRRRGAEVLLSIRSASSSPHPSGRFSSCSPFTQRVIPLLRTASPKEVAELQAGQPQICLHLLLMGRQYPLDRLRLQEHDFLDDNVGPEPLIESDPFVDDWNRDLPFEIQTKIGQLTSQNHLVNRLQKPRLDIDRRFNHLRANVILSLNRSTTVVSYFNSNLPLPPPPDSPV